MDKPAEYQTTVEGVLPELMQDHLGGIQLIAGSIRTCLVCGAMLMTASASAQDSKTVEKEGDFSMTDIFLKIDTPRWMLDWFKSIDDLDTSENSGFQIFASDIVLQFDPRTVHGIEELKKFFVELDAPFITRAAWWTWCTSTTRPTSCRAAPLFARKLIHRRRPFRLRSLSICFGATKRANF